MILPTSACPICGHPRSLKVHEKCHAQKPRTKHRSTKVLRKLDSLAKYYAQNG